MPDFAAARRNMVDTQLRTYDVTSHRVLDAVERVPRDRFVPEAVKALAYSDQPITLAAKDTPRQLLQPMVLARLLQALDIKPGERVLDCAGGSGYGAALATELGASVTAVEETAELAQLTRDSLAAAGTTGVTIRTGAIETGAGADGPFEVIILHGAVEEEPEALVALLADGGRLGLVMGAGRAGRAMVITRNGGVTGRRAVFDAAAPLLPAFRRAPAFSL